MNHRELVTAADKKAKFKFLSLPEELQDEVVEGLDGQKLTIEAARDLIRAKGHSIGHDAVSGYYRAVRRERRLMEVHQAVGRVIEQFAGQPYEQALSAMVNVLIATAMSGLADGSVGIKDVDLGKVLAAVGGAKTKQAKIAEASAEDKPGKAGPPNAEDLKRIRQEIGL